MITRLKSWLVVLFVAADQLAHMILAGPKYVIIGGQRPDPDETISGKVGRRAIAGALLAAHLRTYHQCADAASDRRA